MNHSQNMFNSEVELSKFLSSSTGTIQEVYDVLLKEAKIGFGLYTSSSGIKVLAFMTHPSHRGRDSDLELVDKAIDFISTGAEDSLFSVNKNAIELFNGFNYRLREIENEHKFTPLIITGWGLGGMLAILSALRLQRAVDVEESKGIKRTKRPMCITFGAPLVGGQNFQQAIAKRPQWKSGFLNVVVKKDDGARCFKEGYKPFGTFLFCTESGHCTALEDEKAIIAVLDTMASPDAESLNLQDYKEVLSSIRRKVLIRGGASDLGEGNTSLLKAGIALQLKKVGVSDNILIDEMEKQANMKIKMKNPAYEPTKKLNDSKISLTIMEWYMKTRRLKGGYYDSYKNRHSKEDISSQQDIIKHHRSMKQYWKKFVEEKNLMPQKEGANLRKRWLYSGNNYRRIVEPLEIAEYYKNGYRNYIDNRDNHYKLLEVWLKDDMKDQDAGRGKKNKPAILTEDSCFWAYVEEALISLKDLRNAGTSNNVADIENQLHWFEAYVKSAIEDYSVSQDIFIRGTSFMKWLNEYKVYKGASYALEFDEYVKSKGYIMYPC